MAKLKEQRAYKNLQDNALGILNCKRIENQNGSGMSDFVVQSHYGFDIWLEIKAMDALPVRDTTLPLRGHFEKGQLAFLREKISWGGHGFVALRVDRDWWLFDPTIELELVTKKGMGVCSLVDRGTVKDIINYLENLKHEDKAYAAPNYRPGTIRRKAQLCISDGARHGQDLADAG